MGVCFVAYAVSDANLDPIIADPPLVWRVVEAEDESSYLRELNQAARVSLLARLFGKTKPAPQPRSLAFTKHELLFVDLDKSWDGLRACLKVCAPEAPDFFEGTGSIGKVEVGYGPALYHRSDTLHRIAQAYAGLSAADVIAAFPEVDLRGVYPKGLWQHGVTEIESYLAENFVELQRFVQHTQNHSLGAILQFT